LRFNALERGFRANLLVLPTEESGEHENHLHDWRQSFKPRNPSEEFLVESMVALRFQMKRIQRAHTGRLAARVNHGTLDEADNEQRQVLALTQRLFHNAGSAGAAPKPAPARPAGDDRGTTTTVTVIDPNDPAVIVHELRTTQTGCTWLLEQWGELRSLLERNLVWLASDTRRAVRLLGRRPTDAIDRADIAHVYLASHRLRTQEGDPFEAITCSFPPDKAAM
jgi:hypothetical protein